MKLPRNTTLWATYYDSSDAPRYAIVSDPARTKYSLLSVNGDACEKLATERSPKDFDSRIHSMLRKAR